MVKAFNKSELKERIVLNRKRLLNDEYYQIEQVFSPVDYDWYADKEGRALLAFVSHYKISGDKIPCMDELVAEMPKHTNNFLYFGPIAGEVIHEQQLSGHSWLLRGLCEYYEQFNDDKVLIIIKSIIENLYLHTFGKYKGYPINRDNMNEGGVSGESSNIIGGWKLSTDIGCAFMSIDGLSHAYKITLDETLKNLIDEMISVYSEIDKAALKAQTHCTLTAARGMMRMYDITNNSSYLSKAAEIYDLYVNCGGMTYTYQNLNWWDRPDSWTEPCAVIDSLMLSLMLYKASGNEQYRKTAARIYANGFASLQRDNGGAGTDSLVCAKGEAELYIKMYEAYFCCTMRLAEGLWYIRENADLLYTEVSDEIIKNDNGIYMCGDYIYSEISDNGKQYAETTIFKDGHSLSPLLKFYKIPKEKSEKIKQKIVFNDV